MGDGGCIYRMMQRINVQQAVVVCFELEDEERNSQSES